MKPLASGRTAHVYDLGDGRVLRRYHHDIDVAREVSFMEHVAAHGFPVPRVYEADGHDIVMERVDGLTMREAFDAGRLDVPAAAGHLAGLLNRLRRVPGRAGRDHVVHLDLHGENVLVTAAGPVLIDWANAEDGDPDLDAAISLTIVAQTILEPDEADIAPAMRRLLDLLAAGLDGDPLRGLDEALDRRLANPTMSPAERSRIPAAGDLVRRAWAGR